MSPGAKLRFLWTVEFRFVLTPNSTHTSLIVFSVEDRVARHFTGASAPILVTYRPIDWHIGLATLTKLYLFTLCICLEVHAENLFDEVVIILSSLNWFIRVKCLCVAFLCGLERLSILCQERYRSSKIVTDFKCSQVFLIWLKKTGHDLMSAWFLPLRCHIKPEGWNPGHRWIKL